MLRRATFTFTVEEYMSYTMSNQLLTFAVEEYMSYTMLNQLLPSLGSA